MTSTYDQRRAELAREHQRLDAEEKAEAARKTAQRAEFAVQRAKVEDIRRFLDQDRRDQFEREQQDKRALEEKQRELVRTTAKAIEDLDEIERVRRAQILPRLNAFLDEVKASPGRWQLRDGRWDQELLDRRIAWIEAGKTGEPEWWFRR
jgi:hypothetical protein